VLPRRLRPSLGPGPSPRHQGFSPIAACPSGCRRKPLTGIAVRPSSACWRGSTVARGRDRCRLCGRSWSNMGAWGVLDRLGGFAARAVQPRPHVCGQDHMAARCRGYAACLLVTTDAGRAARRRLACRRDTPGCECCRGRGAPQQCSPAGSAPPAPSRSLLCTGRRMRRGRACTSRPRTIGSRAAMTAGGSGRPAGTRRQEPEGRHSIEPRLRRHVDAPPGEQGADVSQRELEAPVLCTGGEVLRRCSSWNAYKGVPQTCLARSVHDHFARPAVPRERWAAPLSVRHAIHPASEAVCADVGPPVRPESGSLPAEAAGDHALPTGCHALRASGPTSTPRSRRHSDSLLMEQREVVGPAAVPGAVRYANPNHIW
jgi:hypothetical protein